MPISDKNRKILWGKSGSRCAICRQALVVDSTELDSEAVVGDECHIISGAKGGPRYDQNFPSEDIDGLSNLMLLCRVHHKMIDDQAETYTADLLRGIKANHENWVEKKLKDEPEDIPPVRIKRFKSEIPTELPRVSSGKALLNLMSGCFGSYTSYSDDLDEGEASLVGSFLQSVSDWTDLAVGMEPLEQMQAARSLDEELRALQERGFMVFATTENQRLEGGIGPASAIRVLHLTVVRASDSSIVAR